MKFRFPTPAAPTRRARKSDGATVSPPSPRCFTIACSTEQGCHDADAVSAIPNARLELARVHRASPPVERRRKGRPVRVIGVDPELGFAGGESQVLGLTLELIRLGHEAQLLCDPGGGLWQRAQAAGVRCHALK